MNIQVELSTIISTLADCSRRLTVLVDDAGDAVTSETYGELVAAERTIGALQRRLQRASGRLSSSRDL